MGSYLISHMAGLFSVSRSTLLYCDSIGLLVPSLRSSAGYRLYSEIANGSSAFGVSARRRRAALDRTPRD